MAIDFELPPDLAALQARIRRFIADDVMPLETDARRTPHGPSEDLRRELIDKARAAGLLAPHVDLEYGGHRRPGLPRGAALDRWMAETRDPFG